MAAFQAQLYKFTCVEKTKADLRYSLIKEQFQRCPHKHITGACAQLIEGSGAFCLPYDVKEGEDNIKLVLKPSCWGKETSLCYVARVHFTEDDIRTFGHNKKVNGCALWAIGLTVLPSIKKALSIVPKLSPRILMIGKNCAVIGYASRKNKQSFMQLVGNGMFAMMSVNGDDTMIIDGNHNGLDDDNEVLGAVSEAGMPMTRDDALIERVGAKNAEGLPIRPGSPWQGDVDVQDGDRLSEDDKDCDFVEAQTNPLELDSWDPFGRGDVVGAGRFHVHW